MRRILLLTTSICACALGAASQDSEPTDPTEGPALFETAYEDARVAVFRLSQEPETPEELREAVRASVISAVGEPVTGAYDPYAAVATAFLEWPWTGAVRTELLYQQRADGDVTTMALGDLAFPLFLANLTADSLPGYTDFMFVVQYAEGMMQTLITRALVPASAAETVFGEPGAYLIVPRTGLNTGIVLPYEPISVKGFFRNTTMGDTAVVLAEGEVEVGPGCAPATAPGAPGSAPPMAAVVSACVVVVLLLRRRTRVRGGAS